MKASGLYLSALLASALFISAPFQASAQEKKEKPKAEGQEKPKRETYPYQGKVKATDKTAMTITLEGKEKERVVTVTSETKIMNQGKPATFGDVAVGELVRGQVKKADGKENAVSVYIGPAPEKKGGEKKKEGEKKKKE